MRLLLIFFFVNYFPYTTYSQNLSIESNLEGLVMSVGDSFRPVTNLINPDGSLSTCKNLIYYNKKGVFNVGNSISVNPSTGELQANEPGTHEVVVVCVGMDDGKRLSRTYNVNVKYSKTKSIDVQISDNIHSGNYIPYTYNSRTANDILREDFQLEIKSSNPEVIFVNPNNDLKAMSPGLSTLTFKFDGIEINKKISVQENPVNTIFIYSKMNKIKTGDVVELETLVYDRNGKKLNNITPNLSYSGISNDKSSNASAFILGKKFVADISGEYIINASYGNITNSIKLSVSARNARKDIIQVGTGNVFNTHTSDAWFFEGVDGRDYGISGTWGYNGVAYFWDVTDPQNFKKIDSLVVDARIVNDVKASKDGKIGVIAREGASNRKNGIIILDISNPSDVKVLSEYFNDLTGGVHNIYIYEDHIYALNAYAGPSKFDVINIKDPENPKKVGSFKLGEGSAIHDIWVEDGIAYTSNWKDGVNLIDVGNGIRGGSPSNPVLISNYLYESGATHAAFPFKSKSTGKFYVILGDEIFPDGVDGFAPNKTSGFLHFIDFSDINNPLEVARYELPGHGSHNFWIEDDIIYAGMYTGGVRVIDVSGDLLGDLFKQGREIASFNTGSENGFIPNSPMTWGAQLHKGNIFYSDFNTGVGALKLLESSPDNSNVNQVKTDQTFKSALGVKNLLELFEYLASPPKE